MSVSSYDAVAEKVLFDLELTIKKDPSINEFHIIPTSEEQNKNSSPIIKGENTLGLESWIIAHIYPYAHHQILQKNNYRTQNLCKVIPCLTGVALLNPEMPTVWSKRRELIMAKKLHVDNELRLTRMALSRKPKCNDALTHRRWIIIEVLKDVQDRSYLLMEELRLSEMIASRYHSNYYAWGHRTWSLQHLLPDYSWPNFNKKSPKISFYEAIHNEPPHVINYSISKCEFLNFSNCEIACTYFEELENNFKWVSAHVSDHSGLHFRTFLLLEIFSFIKNFFNFSGKNEYQADFQGIQCNLIPSIFTNSKINLTEFLSINDKNNSYKTIIDDYLINLEEELTILDIGMLLIITELKLNSTLCLIFPNHEALWSHRRFIVYSFKCIIYGLNSCKSKSYQKVSVHQDQNGVPCKKDFKFDNAHNSVSDIIDSSFFIALYSKFLLNEEEFLSKIDFSNEHTKTLIRKYNTWFQNCFKECAENSLVLRDFNC